MAKEKVLSSSRKTSSSTISVTPRSAPVVESSNKYKDALVEIVNISAKLDKDPLNRNFRVKLEEAIREAAKLV